MTDEEKLKTDELRKECLYKVADIREAKYVIEKLNLDYRDFILETLSREEQLQMDRADFLLEQIFGKK